MDSLITKARKQYHEKLLSHNVLTIDKDEIIRTIKVHCTAYRW